MMLRVPTLRACVIIVALWLGVACCAVSSAAQKAAAVEAGGKAIPAHSSAVFAAQEPVASQTAGNRALEASLNGNGVYILKVVSTGWRFEGKLSGAVSNVSSGRGKDQIGPYRALTAVFQGGGRAAEIRLYEASPIALFRDTWTSEGPNQDSFPTFQRLPDGALRLSYQQKAFGIYRFGSFGPQGPSLLFDKQGHAALLSPADHFLISRLAELADGGAESRIVDSIKSLPAGFTHATVIVAGEGANQIFSTWGNALLAFSGKRPATNEEGVILSKLGYWTDNGARYYYKFEPQLGYQGTLLAVRDEFKKLGIPLGYMQLDSWWYPKGPDGRWDAKGNTLPFGEYLYRADKTLFPDGLSAFQKQLGLPMVTHARWISDASPYRQQFKMSNNVIVDPAFWKETAAYLHDAGVVTYEQDWLDYNALPQLDLDDPTAFLSDMAEAMRSMKMDMQYCMPLPAHYMASTLYPNLDTIRASDDRLTPQKWDAFLYDSRLASAVGLWPWTDVFFSSELGNLIVSALSAGPVGVGDALGEINTKNLMAAVRPDGFLIKPDSPLLPIDSMYASDATGQRGPMLAQAETRFANTFARYVFSYPRNSGDTETSVSLTDLGMAGPAFAFDWIADTGTLIPSGGALSIHFKNGFAYNVVVPVNRQGLAMLGEIEKIVPLGKERISSLEDGVALTATIKFASGEQAVTIAGYASREPKSKALKGKLENQAYDQKTNMFQVRIAPGHNGEAVLRVSGR